LEVVVADDGSQDETPQIVERFRQQVGFPVKFVTHSHEGFWPARTRNEGFAASSGTYVLFLDGDCVVPPDHLAIHMQMRRPGRAFTCDCVRLDRQTTDKMTEEIIQEAKYLSWIPREEYRRLVVAHWKAVFYHLIRHPRKPRVLSGNLAVWRDDFLRINGFDENYRGWGCEDDDLGWRLHQAGIRVCSIRRWTRTYHLWHPRVETAPQKVRDGLNFPYLHRPGRLTKCRNGLTKRSWSDIAVAWTGRPEPVIHQFDLIPQNRADSVEPHPLDSHHQEPEIEVLVWDDSSPRFRTKADCHVLIVPGDRFPPRTLVRDADWVFVRAGYLDAVRPYAKRNAFLSPLEGCGRVLEQIG